MDWTEIKITVPAKNTGTAGDIAQMVVPYGIYIEDYSALEQEVREIARIDLIDEALLQKDRDKGVIHVYISPEENPKEAVSFLSERLNAEQIAHEITCESCAEEDWLHNWKQYFHPIPVGERLLIRPTWRSEYDPQGRVVLNLDPGLAFGTGTHETTRLCLTALERYMRDGAHVLDVGCGSGILAVASLLLGAGHAVGVDIDELAVKTAKENAALNRVDGRFEAVCGDLTKQVTGTYDVVFANIVADAVILLSKDIAGFLKDDAVYIMSGIIDTRVQEVIHALEGRFEIIEKLAENGWYCLVAKKNKTQTPN